jgi:branched-chain amino acid transport system permease protein
MILKRYLPLLVLVVVVVFVQLVTTIAGVRYYLTQLTMSAYYALLVVGLSLVMGYAGQISLGQAGFFAIGGYSIAAMTTTNLIEHREGNFVRMLDNLGLLIQKENSYGEQILHLTPWIACIVAILVTVIIAFLIGIPVLKLRGHYLAMATLGFGAIIYRLALGSKIFGEADGLTGVPEFTLVPGVAVSGKFGARILNYYIAWFIVALGVFIAINLVNSRVGRGLRSLHGSEEGASAMGVNTSRYKLNIFVLSAVFAAVSGIFLTHYNGGIGPSEASVMKSVRYVAIVAVGGMANIWGTLTMGVILNFLSLRGVFGTYDDAVFGIILIAIMLFAPQGLLRKALFQEIRSLTAPLLKRNR